MSAYLFIGERELLEVLDETDEVVFTLLEEHAHVHSQHVLVHDSLVPVTNITTCARNAQTCQ